MERVYLKDLGLQYNYSELENRNKTDMIVIHHTGNPTDDDLSANYISFLLIKYSFTSNCL